MDKFSVTHSTLLVDKFFPKIEFAAVPFSIAEHIFLKRPVRKGPKVVEKSQTQQILRQTQVDDTRAG